MAYTDLDNRRTVTSHEGMEVDFSVTGLCEMTESLGIEATPEELKSTPAPEIHGTAKVAQLSLASSSKMKNLLGNRSMRKSKRFILLLAAVAIITVIILALAVPLALKLKNPSEQYATFTLNMKAANRMIV